MTKPALLVLAAGIGSRYGGLKQIDPVGPGGETIIDYSIYDALRAGFGRVVFVIRRDIEAAFKETIGARFESRVPVTYVFQEPDRVPPGRKKPWGTGHAILMGAGAITEPFGVINGDDFYGRGSFEVLARQLSAPSPDYALVGFVLRNTLSEFGTVARGLCQASPGGYLETVTEHTKIEARSPGACSLDASGGPLALSGDEIVSMNMWGFQPSLFAYLQSAFTDFLRARGGEEKAEFFIPSVVNDLVNAGTERVRVLRTPDSWFGITYREDRPRVVEAVGRLVRQGDYPERLWS